MDPSRQQLPPYHQPPYYPPAGLAAPLPVNFAYPPPGFPLPTPAAQPYYNQPLQGTYPAYQQPSYLPGAPPMAPCPPGPLGQPPHYTPAVPYPAALQPVAPPSNNYGLTMYIPPPSNQAAFEYKPIRASSDWHSQSYRDKSPPPRSSSRADTTRSSARRYKASRPPSERRTDERRTSSRDSAPTGQKGVSQRVEEYAPTPYIPPPSNQVDFQSKPMRASSDWHSQSRRDRSPPPRSSNRRNQPPLPFSEIRADKRRTSSRDLAPTGQKDASPRVEESALVTPEDILESEKKTWTRCSPADLYYSRDETNPRLMRGTEKLKNVVDLFKTSLVERGEKARQQQPKFEYPPRKTPKHGAHCGVSCKEKNPKTGASDSSDFDSSSSSDDDEVGLAMQELELKKKHPFRLHPELWFNDAGEMNDGPLCRCSHKARRTGIRHGIYAGEKSGRMCDVNSNNSDKLFHYRVTISPPTNFLLKRPTIINHDEHEFIFEGFSLLSHYSLEKVPTCKVIRFNIEYTIVYIEEKVPDNFTVQELELFNHYLFHELLELVDLNLHAAGGKDGCPQFHILPRFVRDLPEHGKELLSMNQVLLYLLRENQSVIDDAELGYHLKLPQHEWQNFVDGIKGMIVTNPGAKPCSLRVDQLDRDQLQTDVISFPEIVHFGIRPPQLSYAGNPQYQKAWRDYVKFRHLLANMPKPSFDDKRKLEAKEKRLQDMRSQNHMKRDVTVAVSSQGFYRTGIMCDVVQHGMLLPVLICHLRFHKSLDVLEESIQYRFKNRYLLQLALTHPSYRENFGTNPDHARNSLTNCGIRQPEYGDRRIHYANTRKRGINMLINIMSRLGKSQETESYITHNERLEFLGDAVVEFLASIHLYHMFPDLEEGGLATYRAAIVQNQHLALLAKNLHLEQFMLYAHGSDLCHDLELRHAMANCFEALMGALFLDGGIPVADKVFSNTLFMNEKDLLDVWVHYPPHPLQEQELGGDRKWISSFPFLQKMTEFESTIGTEFTHIRLLARAFTDRSIGFNNLTLGSNQRLEFLGDTVLQLIASEYLYKFFPEHHEGHLSLLRSSLVNNRTQAVVCDDLGMTNFALYASPKAELKTKDRADLLEAFLGALYVDKGLEYCQVFCQVCFFPRLQDFILHQNWNDPKSKLQQCCLTLRTMEGGEPDIPVYKVTECKGPTNTRVYTVVVYFRNKRLASASGHSIQQAEMNAAKEALESSKDLFPQLSHQKKIIAATSSSKSYRSKGARGSIRGEGDAPQDPEGGGGSGRYLKTSYSVRDRGQFKRERSSSKSRSRSRSKSRSRSRSKSRSRSRSKSRSRSRSSTRSRYLKNSYSSSPERKAIRDRDQFKREQSSSRSRSSSKSRRSARSGAQSPPVCDPFDKESGELSSSDESVHMERPKSKT